MKRTVVILIYIFLVLVGSDALYAANITINLPQGGFTTKRIIAISGQIENYSENRAQIIINGIPQSIPLQGNLFSINTVIAPGLNVVEVKAGRASKKVSFFAKVPKKDIKVLLTWDTPTDIDLWVIDPKGEKCYYSHKSTTSGGNLDVDVISGFGPETFTMAKALPGPYAIQVQYYSSKSQPVTRVNVYVVLYEGTPGERRKHFQFIMTKEHQVYHIADFTIEEQ